MNRLKKEEWEQVVGEFYRAVSVKSEKERNVKKNFLKKVIIGVKKITETGRDPNRNTIKYIDLDKLVETLTEICMQAQRNNKIREINWMRILLLIVEEKTGEDMLSRVIFPPADVDVDDPASRQEYIHERKVNFNLDKSQQPVIASKIAEELWCGTRTIESDLAAIKIFSGISTNIHIEMDINITQCADLIRGLFEQRSELMAKPSSDDIIQQIWHQLRPAIRKKIQSFFETLGEQDLLDYLKNLKNLEKTRKSEWDFLCEACLPVEGKSNWIDPSSLSYRDTTVCPSLSVSSISPRNLHQRRAVNERCCRYTSDSTVSLYLKRIPSWCDNWARSPGRRTTRL
jgi:hypothetical protein